MELSDFLMSHPLYAECDLNIAADDLHKLRGPAITAICPACKAEKTFAVVKQHTNPEYSWQAEYWLVGFTYVCAACQSNYALSGLNDSKGYRYFLVRFRKESGNIRGFKAGQYPPADISIGKALSRALGEHEADYKKGLICEGQGYGIGAYAYYRRIVEQIIDRLLNEIDDLLEAGDKAKYEEALGEVRKDNRAQVKIALVKDLLPQSLRPEGMNPLDILHQALSEGLHQESDEVCLSAATDIREILATLVEKISVARNAQVSDRNFTQKMRVMLEKRRKKD